MSHCAAERNLIPTLCFQHLLDAVAVSKGNLTNGKHTQDHNLSSSYPQDGYRQSGFLTQSLDTKSLNSYAVDPLSLLADVASLEPTPISNGVNHSRNNSTSNHEMEVDEGGDRKHGITLRGLLTKQQVNGSTEKVSRIPEYNDCNRSMQRL